MILLVYKIAEYSYYIINLEVDKIPIEFSTLAYFLFGVVVLFKIKELYPVAAFASFISGIGYLLVFIFMGDQYVVIHGFYSTLIALSSHFILLLGSVLLKNIAIAKTKDIKYIIIYTVFYLIYVGIMNIIIDYSQSYLFINLLLKAEILENMLSTTDIANYIYWLYYIIIVGIYLLVIFIFFKIYERDHSKKIMH
ncbi:hypothetical protein MPAN_015530 [Mariniplasma anaerobium]|uniref:Uncharacterized protein n=2 Tax=Mariniplasma anaerobium TaxID=2735436 RepID=A0A7R7VB63_9MOLU|nr:hypothetical protein MPAN_015530 [Mariniplasma anaerobium]